MLASRQVRCWKAGFTVLELLVVLGVVALLLGIILPALFRVRGQAEDASAKAGLRQVATAMFGYCTNNRGDLPFLGTPGDPDAPLVANGVTLAGAQGGYFGGQSRLWASVIRTYFSGSPRIGGVPVFQPIGTDFGTTPDQADRVLQSRFWLTHTAFAAPQYWSGASAPADLSLYRGTRLSQIRSPARKGFLLDVGSGIFHPSQSNQQSRNDIFVAMGDGSVSSGAFTPQAPHVVRPHGATPLPIMSTERGVEGSDF